MTTIKWSGFLEPFSDQGAEGIFWALQDPGRPGYFGLFILENGDRLKVFDDAGDVIWAGSIKETRRPARRLRAHWMQDGENPDEWEGMFFKSYRAMLERDDRHAGSGGWLDPFDAAATPEAFAGPERRADGVVLEIEKRAWSVASAAKARILSDREAAGFWSSAFWSARHCGEALGLSDESFSRLFLVPLENTSRLRGFPISTGDFGEIQVSALKRIALVHALAKSFQMVHSIVDLKRLQGEPYFRKGLACLMEGGESEAIAIALEAWESLTFLR